MAYNQAPKHSSHVDIGTAIAINRKGPVKPGTNQPLRPPKASPVSGGGPRPYKPMPKKLPFKPMKRISASLKWK